MDAIGLATLRAELEADGAVLRHASEAARDRFGRGTAPELEASAFQLVRFYNVAEQLALRVVKAFENHIDDERGRPSELLRRLSLRIGGVRPALFPAEMLRDLQDVRGFRHIVVHAYDLVLNKEKMPPLLEAAERISAQLPGAVDRFLEEVAAEVE